MGFPRILDKQTNRYNVFLLYNGKIRAIFENLHSAIVFSYMCICSMVQAMTSKCIFLRCSAAASVKGVNQLNRRNSRNSKRLPYQKISENIGHDDDAIDEKWKWILVLFQRKFFWISKKNFGLNFRFWNSAFIFQEQINYSFV